MMMRSREPEARPDTHHAERRRTDNSGIGDSEWGDRQPRRSLPGRQDLYQNILFCRLARWGEQSNIALERFQQRR
jgi:hypothetical protein